MDDIFLHLDRTDIDMFKELIDIYSKHSMEVQDEIFKFYGKYAKEEGISLIEAKKKLRGQDLKVYRENAKKYFEGAEDNPELLKRLKQQYKSSIVTRLEDLYLDIEHELGKLNGSLQSVFHTYLSSTAKYAYSKVMSGSTLSPHSIEELLKTPWNGYNYSEAIWGNTDNLARDLKKAFEKGFIRGLGPRQMAQEIRKKYKVSRHRAETLVRTDGSFVVNSATARRYQDAGLKYYRIHVHLDERTTDICKKINKEDKKYSFYDYEPGKTAPPFHYNCRTTIIPDYDELMKV